MKTEPVNDASGYVSEIAVLARLSEDLRKACGFAENDLRGRYDIHSFNKFVLKK